ncbi:hypothetical protein [Hansschlegelia beijingensis]|uniref:Uncharacterized protein n=1 Tax=Hansschlegelia beijingensis TaxID=1133344 RepID=A0A7W6GEL1_9HYPH|nr:hypothetical protein [Hansschlegelia beijingensis]MBB3972138.1 hypothetical protein [Hansschlegelia beijingensis]
MFYVLENRASPADTAAVAAANLPVDFGAQQDFIEGQADLGSDDIDIVDDALLNTSPHNAIERQLLRGDVVGLALMSGAIIWSAMGAFG